jgi:hypothetical protein
MPNVVNNLNSLHQTTYKLTKRQPKGCRVIVSVLKIENVSHLLPFGVHLNVVGFL